MKRTIGAALAVLAAGFGTAIAQDEAQSGDDTVYLFSSFRNDGETGLHLAWSEDGLTWNAINGGDSVLKPKVGDDLMRDPCIIQGPDGRYHMVWTTGWWTDNIGIAHSDDLVHWSDQTELPVMRGSGTLNSWAPEIFYDEEAGEYLIFWSSAVPGRFPETEDRGDIRSTLGVGINHRVYYVKTKDFETYTPTELFYDGGFVSIDASLIQDGERTVMFVKDETKRPEPEKNVRIAIAADPQGPYGPASPPFTPEGVWVEGPTAVKIDGEFYVYYDAYMEHQMMGARSPDLVHWENITDELSFPDGTRHGTVLPIDRETLNGIREAYDE
ncbi:glycoside hydrolase family 43 protein [Parvularcula dongshanensis]|uniref:Sucrose-6-phosphate hydrolase SacC (GH32 family) n=1 Tax=Parvularcula dongshanensis TaxID=1173995 RepID=A0A840I3X9_9PROT|nr:glycoside hydrolase family 43 protein [Parvularcula dongshanensis]MBB4659579.1 sucrose-6-phosphate hydrolase SacC (GH32 family) [Parvularcula dongshanensis]